jgi:hypothetical protein
MEKTDKNILTDIILENHEEEFRILEKGDDSGHHFSVYLPEGSKTKLIQQLVLEKVKTRTIIITTPSGYIGTILR